MRTIKKLNFEDAKKLEFFSVLRLKKDLDHICDCKKRKDFREHTYNKAAAAWWFISPSQDLGSFLLFSQNFNIDPENFKKELFYELDTQQGNSSRTSEFIKNAEEQLLVLKTCRMDKRSGRPGKHYKTIPFPQRVFTKISGFVELDVGPINGCREKQAYVADMAFYCSLYALGLNDTPWTDLLHIEKRGRCGRIGKQV